MRPPNVSIHCFVTYNCQRTLSALSIALICCSNAGRDYYMSIDNYISSIERNPYILLFSNKYIK